MYTTPWFRKKNGWRREQGFWQRKRSSRASGMSSAGSGASALGKSRKNIRFRFPEDQKTLTQLFSGRSQLMIYHFMLGPGWDEGCAEAVHT